MADSLTDDEAKIVKDFFSILSEFDRKYEFTGAMPERFTKIFNTYFARLKTIHKQLNAPAAK